jgi:hypothetical protein
MSDEKDVFDEAIEAANQKAAKEVALMPKPGEKRPTAHCTWGEGPDVLIVLDGTPLMLHEEAHSFALGKNGFVNQGSMDLTRQQAVELARELLMAAETGKNLDDELIALAEGGQVNDPAQTVDPYTDEPALPAAPLHILEPQMLPQPAQVQTTGHIPPLDNLKPVPPAPMSHQKLPASMDEIAPETLAAIDKAFEIITIAETILERNSDNEGFPGVGFLNSVSAGCSDMMETLKDKGMKGYKATQGQLKALENWERGVRAWNR